MPGFSRSVEMTPQLPLNDLPTSFERQFLKLSDGEVESRHAAGFIRNFASGG